jgi:RNA 2',3'-cyclic 3'-phosphodiesterase
MPAACSVSTDMATPDSIRAFIAIVLPPEFKRGLKELRTRLDLPGQNFLKWVDTDSIHLTLKFLGDISPESVTPITEAMRAAAASQPAFTLQASGTGAFPNPDRIQVAWVGLDGNLKALGRLQQSLENNLSAIGFPKEKRAFTPHLTLARLRDSASPDMRRSFGSRLARTGMPRTPSITVGDVSLFQSRLERGGAVHTRLAVAKLNVLSADR